MKFVKLTGKLSNFYEIRQFLRNLSNFEEIFQISNFQIKKII